MAENGVNDWSDIFIYDLNSPSKLSWKHAIVDSLGRKTKIKAGSWAGSYSPVNNRFTVEVNGIGYQCHRIVYELTSGPIPLGFVVDHINGDSSDNYASNLRAVPAEVNARNVKKSSANTSGTSGVGWWQCGRNFYARARWTANGELKQKSFNIAEYGAETAFKLAVLHRKAMIEELNKQGAGYTERHGNEQ